SSSPPWPETSNPWASDQATPSPNSASTRPPDINLRKKPSRSPQSSTNLQRVSVADRPKSSFGNSANASKRNGPNSTRVPDLLPKMIAKSSPGSSRRARPRSTRTESPPSSSATPSRLISSRGSSPDSLLSN